MSDLGQRGRRAFSSIHTNSRTSIVRTMAHHSACAGDDMDIYILPRPYATRPHRRPFTHRSSFRFFSAGEVRSGFVLSPPPQPTRCRDARTIRPSSIADRLHFLGLWMGGCTVSPSAPGCSCRHWSVRSTANDSTVGDDG
jgi:hypothetical protein